MSGCKRWVLLGCLVSVGCKEVPEDFSSATSGVVIDAGATPAASADSGGSGSSDAATVDAATDGSSDATRAENSDASTDGGAASPDAQTPAGDGSVTSDASMDAAADASAEGGANLADAATADAAAAGWPSGCTVHRVTPPQPISIPAGAIHAPVIVLPAPWGDAEAQALAFRSIPDSPALREMSLQAVTGNVPLALTGPMPVSSPTLPADVGMFLPSGAGSLRLRPQYDNRGMAATQDRSSFEICVLTGASRRPKTAGFVAYAPALPDVPAMVEKYDLRSRCRLHLSQSVQVLAAQPFARKRAVASRLAAIVGASADTSAVIHQGAYSAADPKLIPLAMPVTLTDGESLLSTCTYTNPSSESFSFGPGLEDEACVHYLLQVPRTTFSCTPEAVD